MRPGVDLALVVHKLRRPLSAQEREELRRIVVAYVRQPAGRSVAEAEAVLLAAAADLAGHGWDEMEIRDLLEREAACLERASRRQGRRA